MLLASEEELFESIFGCPWPGSGAASPVQA
ncbi:hypothetical protein P3T29_006396 [Kitasatospora sp. MAP5-34]|nr:hypothetical protein [Kitasatospora sp. MAP5-34]